MLEKEFQFYQDHQQELAEKYHGKFLVIRGQEVVGVYGSELEAYSAAKKSFPIGTFLIQKCLSRQEDPTQIFHSRVGF
jgi:hypothetical protein